MSNRYPNVRAILIGGSSHVGKSTLAKSLAARLGWAQFSTDSLARHPGRPWRSPPDTVPRHVAEHYLSQPADQLFEDVLHHYKTNVWPKVEEIVASYSKSTSTQRIVVEGSALWPGFAASTDNKEIAAIWLTAREEVFRERIYRASCYDSNSRVQRDLVDRFLERTLVYNVKMVEIVKRHDFILLHVADFDVQELTDRCLARLGIDRQ